MIQQTLWSQPQILTYTKKLMVKETIDRNKWQTQWLLFRIVPFIYGNILQHLRMEFTYHNSYIMPELAFTTHTFCISLDFLQLGFWNRVIMPQDWRHHYRSLWSSSWTCGSLRSIHVHHENWFVQRVIVFLSSFIYHGHDFLWATRRVFLKTQMTLIL